MIILPLSLSLRTIQFPAIQQDPRPRLRRQPYVQQLVIVVGQRRVMPQHIARSFQLFLDLLIRVRAIFVAQGFVHCFREIGGRPKVASDCSSGFDEVAGQVGVEPEAVHAQGPDELKAKDDVEDDAGEAPNDAVSIADGYQMAGGVTHHTKYSLLKQ